MKKSAQNSLVLLILGLMLLTTVACQPAAASSDATALSPTATLLPPSSTPTPPPSTPTTPAPATPTAVPTISATFTPTPAPPQFTNPADADLAQTAVAYNAEFIRPDLADTGLWQYASHTFIHPLALVTHEEMAYLLDGGRVLALSLAQPAPPQLLLAPGDVVDGAAAGRPDGVMVIEPLDLFAASDGLLVLDRAGDVYRRDWAGGDWSVVRYDRPIGDSSSHYYVAIDGEGDGRTLLETSYKYVLQTSPDAPQALWLLPEGRAVDVAQAGENVYVLLQEMATTDGRLHLYRQTASVPSFRPPAFIRQPRQVVATPTAVYLLDVDGRRLLVLDPAFGQLRQIWQLPAEVSAIGLTAAGDLLLAGRDRLYFPGQPQKLATIAGDALLVAPQPHDPAVLRRISGFASPIGPNLAARDLQMPGAPRHYRLGVHQGADFYWRLDAPVYAAADGTVVRALHDYAPPTLVEFDIWRAEAQALGYTSAAGLDFFRGRQVWIEHDGGLVSRYVHLNSIDYRIQEGQPVTQGQLIGTVGNSGSPASLESADADAHLHFELWLGDHYVGQFLRPVETRDWFERILLGN